MNAASQVPSGVLISTLVSTTSMPAAAAEPAAAASPAATPSATKSRLFLRSFVSSAMLVLLLLNALHPLENRPGNAGIRGIGRHHFRDVAVILEHHVSRTFSRFAQFTLCKAGKCPTYMVFKDHSHISEVMSPDTADTSVTGPILKWMKSVK